MPGPVNQPFGPPDVIDFTLIRTERGRYRASWREPAAERDGQQFYRSESFSVYGRQGVNQRALSRLRDRIGTSLDMQGSRINLSLIVDAENRGVWTGNATARCNHENGTQRGSDLCRDCRNRMMTSTCEDCGRTTYTDALGVERTVNLTGTYYGLSRHDCAEGHERREREAAAERLRRAEEERQRRIAERERNFYCELGTGEIR